MSLLSVNDSDFNENVIDSQTPVLVDFWAEWCGPCRMITPVLEELSNETGSQIKIVKMNIDENPNTPAQFGVRSIPTLTIFKNGYAVSTKVGVMPKAKIQEWINEIVSA